MNTEWISVPFLHTFSHFSWCLVVLMLQFMTSVLSTVVFENVGKQMSPCPTTPQASVFYNLLLSKSFSPLLPFLVSFLFFSPLRGLEFLMAVRPGLSGNWSKKMKHVAMILRRNNENCHDCHSGLNPQIFYSLHDNQRIKL